MARRPSRSLAALLLAGALAACSSSGAVVPPTTGLQTETTSTVSAPTTTQVASPSTTITLSSTTTFPFEFDGAELGLPDGEGPFPAVVLVHGGGWMAGSPSNMDPLAKHLNDNGFLTVNTSYSLATLNHAGFPAAVEDISCAVRYAATHPDSDGTVTVIGHSAGAHIGALVSLTGDQYVGSCTLPGPGLPQRFVGLAGPYDVSRLGPAIAAFFGGSPDRVPDLWEAGNPQLHTDANPELASLIMYGERDGFVPESFALDFHRALADSGSETLIELVEGARHNDMQDPSHVGELIVTWLSR